MNLKRKKALSLTIAMFTVIGFSQPSLSWNNAKKSNEVVQNVNEKAQVNWTQNVIRVKGVGAPPDKGNAGQKRLMALRAAKADAYRNLAETINGVNVSAETEVRDFITASDVIKTRVEGLIRGAEEIGEPKYMSDGSVEIELQMRIFGSNSLATAVMPEEITKEYKVAPPAEIKPVAPVQPERDNTSQYTPEKQSDVYKETTAQQVSVKEEQTENAPATRETQAYTGIILDCRGLNVEPAMSPAVFAMDGNRIYIPNVPIDPDYVINTGIISYETDLETAKSNFRAGANPLILKGKKVLGIIKSDIEIDNETAELMRQADEKAGIMKDFKFVMVI